MQVDKEGGNTAVWLAVLALFQDWLYFGFLRVFLDLAGNEFDRDDFLLTRSDGKSIVTMTRLPLYISYWYAREISLPKTDPERMARHGTITIPIEIL